MAGYTGEKRWNGIDGGVSALAQGVCVDMIQTLTTAEAAYSELQELYVYSGSTVQLLAALLFTDDIAARTTPGTNAVVTVDVVATTGSPAVASDGSLSNPQISVAGTGYTDGNFSVNVTLSESTPNSGVLSYTVENGIVTTVSLLTSGRQYPTGNGQIVTSFPLAGGVSETVANADELAKAQALFDAITALHELYQAADNVAVAQEDRLAQIRRMT